MSHGEHPAVLAVVLDAEAVQTKVLRTVLLIFSTLLPTLLLFTGFGGGFDWISLGLAVTSCLIAGYLIYRLNNHQPAYYFLGLCTLVGVYVAIAIRSFGTGLVVHDLLNGSLALVCAAVIVGFIIVGWVERHQGSDTTPPLSAAEILGIVLLAITAFAVRLYALDSIPATRVLEARFGIDARAVLTNQQWNPFALTFDHHNHLFSVILALAMAVLGDSFVAVRTVSALVGSLTVLLLYVAARRFFDIRTAWLASLVFVAMAVHLEFSRIATPAVFDALLLCAVLAFLSIGWDTGKRRGYVGAGLALALCQYSYHSAKIIPVVFALWLGLVALQSWELVPPRRASLTMMWGIAFVGSLPAWWNIFVARASYIEAIQAISLFGPSDVAGQTWLTRIAADSGQPVWLTMLYTVRDAAAAFLVVPLRDGYDVGVAMLTLPSALLFVIGILLMVREYDDPRYWVLFIGLLSAVAVAAVTINTPAAQRMVYVTPFVALIVGIGLAQSSRWLRLEWIQSDWHLPNWLVQFIGIALAIGIAGYDANNYLVNNRFAAIQPADAMASSIGATVATYPSGSTVYAFTEPALRYTGNPILEFQAPQVVGVDVSQPLTTTPDWVLDGPKQVFFFAPARSAELALIRSAYPGGVESRIFLPNGETLLLSYVLDGVPSLKTP